MLFSYPGRGRGRPRAAPDAVAAARPRDHEAASRAGRPGRRLRLGFVGAGNYASSMLLPHLAERADVALTRVATTSALSASNAQRKFGFADASTDIDAVLGGPGRRRRLRRDPAQLARRAHPRRRCSRGKAVFVEKPLALTEAELETGARRDRGVRQRPAAGRLQPPVRAAADRGRRRSSAAASARRRSATWSTPARSTTAAGTRATAPRAPGSSARAATSSTP